MSVIVKGVGMPSCCGMCPMAHRNFDGNETRLACYALCKWAREDEAVRRDDCPLVELPEKHGDLIDKNELLKQMNTAIAMMSGMMKALDAEGDEGMQMELKAYRDIRDGIKAYQAVIEAEGGE